MTETALKSDTELVTDWLDSLGAALERRDVNAALELFDDESYWRDLVSFTWNIKTMEGAGEIGAMLDATAAQIRPSDWSMVDEATRSRRRCRGLVQLRDGALARHRPSAPQGRALPDAAHHHAGAQGPRGAGGRARVRPASSTARSSTARTGSTAGRAKQRALGRSVQPYCVIIGGGQGGIALGARLKRLGVPTIILEKNARAGDSWRNRYKSLVLHDPVWYDHLPYLPFPDHWPVFTPKDQMGDWLEIYAGIMELDYWARPNASTPATIRRSAEWAVLVERGREQVVLRPKQLVFATGSYGPPNELDLPGAGRFAGDAISFEPACQRRAVRRQELRRHRLQHVGARHVRRSLGARRRRDHGAAFADARGEVGDADGAWLRQSLFRAGGAERHDDREGRPVVRLGPVPADGRPADPALRAHRRSTTRTSTRGSANPDSSRLRRGRIGPDDEGLRTGSGYYIDVGASD